MRSSEECGLRSVLKLPDMRSSQGKLRSSPLPCRMLDFSFATFEALRLKDFLCFFLRFLRMLKIQKQHKTSNHNEIKRLTYVS